MRQNRDAMVIIYDGACPFCVNYVALMNLREIAGTVHLIDARSETPDVTAVVRQGYDLNEGMAVVFGGAVYHGKDAVTFIASLTNSRSWAGSLLSKLLRSPTIAAILYPIMKLGRRITLKALRKPLLKI